MLSYLKQPYPSKYTATTMLKMAVIFALAVGGFLFIFKPFGIASFTTEKVAFLSGIYALVTFSVLSINALIVYLFKSHFNEDGWTIGREIFWMGYCFLAISILNYLAGVYILKFEHVWSDLFEMIWQTIVVGFIPFMLLTFFRQVRLLKQHLKEANEMNKKLHQPHASTSTDAINLVLIESENEREQGVELNPADLLYIESSDNYIEVFWLENDCIKKALLRSTLKRIEESFENHPNFFRCHRAYIINPNRIEEVEGNSQGYKVLLHQELKQVPVARGRQADFKQIYAL